MFIEDYIFINRDTSEKRIFIIAILFSASMHILLFGITVWTGLPRSCEKEIIKVNYLQEKEKLVEIVGLHSRAPQRNKNVINNAEPHRNIIEQNYSEPVETRHDMSLQNEPQINLSSPASEIKPIETELVKNIQQTPAISLAPEDKTDQVIDNRSQIAVINSNPNPNQSINQYDSKEPETVKTTETLTNANQPVIAGKIVTAEEKRDEIPPEYYSYRDKIGRMIKERAERIFRRNAVSDGTVSFRLCINEPQKFELIEITSETEILEDIIRDVLSELNPPLVPKILGQNFVLSYRMKFKIVNK